jgi:predicted Co/Zn/Cd cation transporter (cation efflux family)
MIDFGWDPNTYMSAIVAVAFAIAFALPATMAYKNKCDGAFAVSAMMIIICLIGAIFVVSVIYNTIPYTETLTICNKENQVLISNEQKEYVLDEYTNYYQLNMKATVGRTITAHMYQENWFGKNSDPVIYAIDGPIPCGNGTCGG